MKRKTAWVIGAMLCAGCLWGCGDNTTPTTETTQEATTTEEVTTEAATTETTTEATEDAESTVQDSGETESTGVLPISEAVDMTFASGVGGWATELTLNPDGSFNGKYHDSEMGDIGDDYPDGSMYIATFTGHFSDIKKVNDYTYSMKLSDINVEEKEEKIEDGIRYIPGDVYGISDGDTFYFYTKDAPIAELSEDFLSWRMATTSEAQQSADTLSGYGLYNEKEGCGFYTYEE